MNTCLACMRYLVLPQYRLKDGWRKLKPKQDIEVLEGDVVTVFRYGGRWLETGPCLSSHI